MSAEEERPEDPDANTPLDEPTRVAALIQAWNPDDFRLFAQFMCGYAPHVVDRWHQEYVRPRVAGEDAEHA